MLTPYQRQYARSQDRIAYQIETLKSLLDGNAQGERITEHHVVNLVAIENQLDELIALLGGVEALQ